MQSNAMLGGGVSWRDALAECRHLSSLRRPLMHAFEEVRFVDHEFIGCGRKKLGNDCFHRAHWR
jgi:hypothetical protein